jgi:hypothetical protein
MKVCIYVFIVLLFCQCNDGKTNKENVEQQNREKFDSRGEKKEAQFVVNTIDRCYAVLELAALGTRKEAAPGIRDQAQQTIEEYTSIMNRLKIYAEDNGISVPLKGPENTRAGVEDLRDEEGEKFNKKWCEELMKYNLAMINDLNRYKDQPDTGLLRAIDTTLVSLQQQQRALEDYVSENEP